jgi:hypothetical protein
MVMVVVNNVQCRLENKSNVVESEICKPRDLKVLGIRALTRCLDRVASHSRVAHTHVRKSPWLLDPHRDV